MPNADTIRDVENDSNLTSFIPADYTDVGQAAVLSRAYRHKLRYCENAGWLTYKDGVWTASETEAQAFSQKITELQMQEAENMQVSANADRYKAAEAKAYLEFAGIRRSSARISATLREAMPMLGIKTDMLDADPLILNTPAGEVRLDTGEVLPHDPEHLLTHITRCAPSEDGMKIWNGFVQQISCGNEEITYFLKQVAGMAAIGKVYEERLIIAVGSGGNGKSTFFNAIQDALGDYSCTIRSALLISSNDSGKKFELARLRGKRFIIAEELEEGKQLDTAAVKQLCSTGDINAQFKGKDVFTFKPSHSVVLCTNHMPSVKVVDSGTWDRLLVIPFSGKFRNQANEIKNYGSYLADNCGGAIIKWVIEGAMEYVKNDYKLVIPDSIKSAVDDYKQENDWLTEFFAEHVELDQQRKSSGSEIYNAYTEFCAEHGEMKLAMNTVLPMIAERANVQKKRGNKGFYYLGIRII